MPLLRPKNQVKEWESEDRHKLGSGEPLEPEVPGSLPSSSGLQPGLFPETYSPGTAGLCTLWVSETLTPCLSCRSYLRKKYNNHTLCKAEEAKALTLCFQVKVKWSFGL